MQNGLRETEKERRNLVPNSVHTRLAQESSKRNRKKFKKFKNPFLALFLAKTGWARPRKWKKNFSPEFRSYSAREENCDKNSKKIQKIKKPLSGVIFIQNGMR